jgi:hypothetical protein
MPAGAAFKLPAERAHEPLLLEATRFVGLTDRRLARMFGVSPQLIYKWRCGKDPIPVRRRRVIIEILNRICGIPDPVGQDHLLTWRATIVRDAVGQLVEKAVKDLPPATWTERNAAETEAYACLRSLGIRRLLPNPPEVEAAVDAWIAEGDGEST